MRCLYGTELQTETAVASATGTVLYFSALGGLNRMRRSQYRNVMEVLAASAHDVRNMGTAQVSARALLSNLSVAERRELALYNEEDDILFRKFTAGR